ASAPGGGAPDDAALLAGLFERVTIDDGGVPERGAEIRRAFALMLKAPTARALAERYVAEGAPAVVRFANFPGSQVFEESGVKRFYGKRAETPWREDRAEVLLNEDYLKVDRAVRDRDLPPVLAHELFGHALWYSRAAREGAYLAFHHHELNEANARLVGWLVDFELDGFLEEQGAWRFLQDPARYLSGLKLRLPYYATTFSSAEMGSPVESLEARREAALAKRARLETERANHRTWSAVIDHFVSRHGLPEARVRALRRYMVDTDANYGAEIAVMDDIVATVDGLLKAMRAEPDAQAEKYLTWAATHPIFEAVGRENDANARRLLEMVRESGARPEDEPDEVRRAREEHWRGQVTFDELERMYREDRERRPDHWR
ncbi:MAG: hypothetical protein KGM24_01275, partial [Elusimicrobia bacterium]|nr:hypothetical protein [Elusimicrobiota bacterium]